MRRAMDLMDLHYGVKLKHVKGEDKELREARREVDEVLERLKGWRLGGKGVTS